MTALKLTPEQTDSANDISVLRFRPSGLLLCCLLLLVSAVAWRKGTYFSGGFDLVVVIKAGLTTVALVIAWAMPRKPQAWARLRVAPLFWLLAYLGVSIVGALLHGDAFASFVLAARVLMMGMVLLLLVLSHPWQAVLSALTSAMVLLAGFGSLTGLASIAETGRLYGGIPPLNANEICMLCSVPTVVLLWKVVHGRPRSIEYVGLLLLLLTIWLTGARTGLAALIVAIMLLIMLGQRLATPLAVALAAAIPGFLWITFFTPWVSKFASRGDPSNITTLNSRTVAWQAAIDYPETALQSMFGSGLALKQIPVTAMYRDTQILDSTWVSALLQVGMVGIAVMFLFVGSTLVHALRWQAPYSHLLVAIVAMLTIVSVLESGMFDSTPAFMTFFTMALLAAQQPQDPAEPDSTIDDHRPGSGAAGGIRRRSRIRGV